MRNKFKFALVSLLIGCVSAAPKTSFKVGEEPISFARLEANSIIKVHFESQGCFHHFVQHFMFTNDMSPQVQIMQPDQKRLTGHLAVEQLRRLDSLLKFYRETKHSLQCTTVDTIEVVLLRNGAVVKREHYTDDSGETDTYQTLRKWVDGWDKRIPVEERKSLENLTTFRQIQTEIEHQAKSTGSGVKAAAKARRK